MYNMADPNKSHFMVRPDTKRLIPISYKAPITTEWWDNDGSLEYQRMFTRIEREEIVIENH